MSPLGGRSLGLFCVKSGNRKMKGKCEDISAYRNVDRGRTYGPEDRCCLFLTGPVWPAVSDGEMFIRSSKVAIFGSQGRRREKRKEGEGGGDNRKRRKREEVKGAGNEPKSVSVAIPCQLVTVTSPTRSRHASPSTVKSAQKKWD